MGSKRDVVQLVARPPEISRAISPRLQLVWTLNATSGEPEKWWPGSQVVDVVSFDYYSKVGDPAADFERARSHPGSGFERIAALAAREGKPLAIDEWGATKDRGAFVDRLAQWIAARPLLWHGYYDHGDTEISAGLAGTTGARYVANFRLE